MLSLSELPPPPQLDKSYSQSELVKRDVSKEQSPQSVQREGWVVVGSGSAVAEIPVSEEQEQEDQEDGAATPNRSQRINLHASSTASSLTTLSRRSSVASGQVGVTTHPEYDPIDIGDEHPAESEGQHDRADGKVDAVFKLHSNRRMKPSSTGRGVSIPSRKSGKRG